MIVDWKDNDLGNLSIVLLLTWLEKIPCFAVLNEEWLSLFVAEGINIPHKKHANQMELILFMLLKIANSKIKVSL